MFPQSPPLPTWPQCLSHERPSGGEGVVPGGGGPLCVQECLAGEALWGGGHQIPGKLERFSRPKTAGDNPDPPLRSPSLRGCGGGAGGGARGLAHGSTHVTRSNRPRSPRIDEPQMTRPNVYRTLCHILHLLEQNPGHGSPVQGELLPHLTGRRQRHSATWKAAPVSPRAGGKTRICILVSLCEFYTEGAGRGRGKKVKKERREEGERGEGGGNPLPLNT